MKLFYKSPFRQFVKKQSRSFQLVIEDEIENIESNPDVGKAKKGDLSGRKVHKFRFNSQHFLVAYCLRKDEMTFYMIESHENFYRNLKKYLKECI